MFQAMTSKLRAIAFGSFAGWQGTYQNYTCDKGHRYTQEGFKFILHIITTLLNKNNYPVGTE